MWWVALVAALWVPNASAGLESAPEEVEKSSYFGSFKWQENVKARRTTEKGIEIRRYLLKGRTKDVIRLDIAYKGGKAVFSMLAMSRNKLFGKKGQPRFALAQAKAFFLYFLPKKELAQMKPYIDELDGQGRDKTKKAREAWLGWSPFTKKVGAFRIGITNHRLRGAPGEWEEELRLVVYKR